MSHKEMIMQIIFLFMSNWKIWISLTKHYVKSVKRIGTYVKLMRSNLANLWKWLSFDLVILLLNIFFQFLNYFIVIQLQLSAFSPHLSTPPQPNSPPFPASTLPLGFVHVPFIVVPENPAPHYPFPPPLWLLLDCS